MTASAIHAANDVLDRANGLLILDAAGTPEEIRQDLRRLAWAMTAAAIDTYMHWRVRSVDLNGSLPKALGQLTVPFSDLVDSGKRTLAARRQGVDDRPAVRARNTLHEAILTATFQSSRGVEKALSMAGAKKPWAAISSTLGETPQSIQDHLNRIAHRRNQIVHEGDIQRQSRPRTIRHQTMSLAEVRDELGWVRSFLAAVDTST